MNNSQRVFCTLLAATLISACGSQRPVVYPKASNAATDRARANQAIDTCVTMAKDGGVYASSGGAEAGRRAAEDATVGAAAGAAAGAVYGRPGRGAAAGAAGGLAGGLVRSLFRTNERGPDAPTRRYVEACLVDRGYQVSGWR